MAMVIARILLRYGAGALIAHGLLAQDVGTSLAADPDIQIAAGALLGFIAESMWIVARRRGWER